VAVSHWWCGQKW